MWPLSGVVVEVGGVVKVNDDSIVSHSGRQTHLCQKPERAIHLSFTLQDSRLKLDMFSCLFVFCYVKL